MSGHCRHCRECEVGLYLDRNGDANGDSGATWPTGHCPACAEAEGFAKAISAKVEAAGDSQPVGSGKVLAGYRSGLAAAANIIRGEA